MKIRKNAVIHYLLLYMVLIFQGSVFFNNNQDILYISVFLIVAVMAGIKHFKFQKRYITNLILLLFSLFITFITSGGSLSIASILNILSRFLLVYIAYYYNEDKFIERFLKLNVFLAAISIVMYALQMVNINIITAILPRETSSSNIYYGKFLYTYAYGSSRNCGIYTEPGLYSIVLTAALFVALFFETGLSAKQQRIYTSVLVIALVSAKSTTGYLSLLIILGFLLMKSKTMHITKTARWILLGIIIFVAIDLYIGENGLIQRYFIDKLFSSDGKIDLTVSSGKSRYYSMIADMNIAKSHPFGIGYSTYSDIWRNYLEVFIPDRSSCVGITKSCATIGLFSTAIIIYFLVENCFRSYKDKGVVVLFIVLLLNITLGQPQILFPALMILTLIRGRLKGKTDISGDNR